MTVVLILVLVVIGLILWRMGYVPEDFIYEEF